MEAHTEKQMTMKTQWPQACYATKAGLGHMYPNAHLSAICNRQDMEAI